MSRRGPTPKRGWQQMLPATPQLTDAQQAARVAAGQPMPEMWMNDRYTVTVERFHTLEADCTCTEMGAAHQHPTPSCPWNFDKRPVVHLSIRRNDRKPLHDWRDLYRIKNDIAGHDVEAVELYPSVRRLVDEANQFHLWCLPPGDEIPMGYGTRLVGDDTETNGDEVYASDLAAGAVQRPLDPADPPQPVDDAVEAWTDEQVAASEALADMPFEVDEDALLAAYELVGRTGATALEMGYANEEATTAAEASWWAYAQYRGARVMIEDQTDPVQAVEGLARKLLTGAMCTGCQRIITLSGVGVNPRRCRWTRNGRHWVRGEDCPNQPRTQVEAPR